MFNLWKYFFVIVILSSKPCFAETLTIHSGILAKTIELDVSLPKQYEVNEKDYPVIVVFDGDGYFSLVSKYAKELHLNHKIPELIVISINTQDRYNDFVGNGYQKFQRFLVEDVFPQMKKNYRIQDFIIGSGHSLGASFLLKSLTDKTPIFDSLSMSSPVVSKRVNLDIINVSKNLITYLNSGHSVYLAKGNETKQYQESFDVLSNLENSEYLATQKFDNQTHGSVALIAPFFGLTSIFDGYIIPTIENLSDINSLESLKNIGGYSKIKAYYENYSKKRGYHQQIPDIIISRIAFTYVSVGKLDELISLFEVEGKNRSVLIYYVSNALIANDKSEYAKKLLLLDKVLNGKYEPNHQLLQFLM